MLGWGEASTCHRRLTELHHTPTAKQVTGKPSERQLSTQFSWTLWFRMKVFSGIPPFHPEWGGVGLECFRLQPLSIRSKRQDQVKDWSGVASAQQRASCAIQPQYPSTACRAQFCLLCCQPEPVPRSLTARMPRLTSCQPCRLHAWMG